MATGAVTGYGVLLKRGNGGGPETFTSIGEVFGIPAFLGVDRDMIDATTTESTARYEEVIPGVIRTPEVQLEVHFLPASSAFTSLRGDLEAGTLRNFQIVAGDGASTTWQFSAYVKGMAPSAAVDDKAVYTLTLKPSGQPDWTIP